MRPLRRTGTHWLRTMRTGTANGAKAPPGLLQGEGEIFDQLHKEVDASGLVILNTCPRATRGGRSEVARHRSFTVDGRAPARKPARQIERDAPFRSFPTVNPTCTF